MIRYSTSSNARYKIRLSRLTYCNKISRRRVTAEDRTTPCEVCGIPISDRHHILKFSTEGENLHVMQLCPTCHVLLHTAIDAIVFSRQRATLVWNNFKRQCRDKLLVTSIENRVYLTAEIITELDNTNVSVEALDDFELET